MTEAPVRSAHPLNPSTTHLPPGKERAVECARIAADLRCRDVVILEVQRIVGWTDYLVIGTGASRRQIAAVADEVERRMKAVGDKPLAIEGYETGGWTVLDFGDVVVHFFDEEKRAYYQLERLWEDAPRIEWSTGADVSPGAGGGSEEIPIPAPS
jgi:ribosome-associated protein